MTITWGTVTSTSPLAVQLDGDSSPLPFEPVTLIDPSLLSVSDRVRCEITARRVVVLGVAGGVPAPDLDPDVQVASFTTPSLADGATWQGTVTLARGYQLLRIETSHAARVRLYLSAAYQSADASRAVGVLPGPDAGLTFEEDGASVADYALAWPVLGASLEDSSSIAVSVTNRSGSTRSIGVDLTWR